MASAWPGLARSADRMARLVVLNPGPANPRQASLTHLFTESLRQLGHDLGRNLAAQVLYGEGDLARLQAHAQEAVRSQPDLILALGNEAIAAAQRATGRIPIIMAFGGEPVQAGFVRSLAHPGGNITGTVWVAAEIAGKTLQVLKDAAPQTRVVAGLGRAFVPGFHPYRETMLAAAQVLGLRVVPVPLERVADVTPALQRLATALPDALYVAPDGVTETRAEEIAAFAQRHRLPCLGISSSLLAAGGLLYYGPDLAEVFARTASFIDRVLRGAAPAELPVETPTRITLVVNLKAARAMRLSLPRLLMARADEVLE